MWLAVNWRWELKGLEIGGGYVYLCMCVCMCVCMRDIRAINQSPATRCTMEGVFPRYYSLYIPSSDCVVVSSLSHSGLLESPLPVDIDDWPSTKMGRQTSAYISPGQCKHRLSNYLFFSGHYFQPKKAELSKLNNKRRIAMVTLDSFFAFYVVGGRRHYLVAKKEGDILSIDLFLEMCCSVVDHY